MRIVIAVAIAAVAAAAALPAHADIVLPTHGCAKPIKPYRFKHDWERDTYFREVESFRKCVQEFIEEQQAQLENHRLGIDKAKQELADFEKYQGEAGEKKQ